VHNIISIEVAWIYAFFKLTIVEMRNKK